MSDGFKMKINELLLETYQDEVALQNISVALADVFYDKDRTAEIIKQKQDIKKTPRLKDFIPSSVFGHLYARLGNYEFIPWYLNGPNTNSVDGEHHPHKSPSMRFGNVRIGSDITKDRLEQIIIHELKHALHNSKQAKTDANFKTNFHIQNKFTKPTNDYRNKYLSKQAEILSRYSEATRLLKIDLSKEDINNISTGKIKELIFLSLDQSKLAHIFKTSNELVGNDEELNIFGRHTPRYVDVFNPLDNKYYRHLFKKLYEFAQKYIEQKKGMQR